MTSRWLMDEIRERALAKHRATVERALLAGQQALGCSAARRVRGLRYWLKTNKRKEKRDAPA